MLREKSKILSILILFFRKLSALSINKNEDESKKIYSFLKNKSSAESLLKIFEASMLFQLNAAQRKES